MIILYILKMTVLHQIWKKKNYLHNDILFITALCLLECNQMEKWGCTKEDGASSFIHIADLNGVPTPCLIVLNQQKKLNPVNYFIVYPSNILFKLHAKQNC